jgi:hypothetical protein
MAMQNVGHVGSGTNDYAVQALLEKTIDRLSRRASIAGALTMDAKGRDRLVKTTEYVGKEVDIANSSVIQTKEVVDTDEARFTLIEDFKGMPTHGNQAVRTGAYPDVKHDLVRINVFDTPEYPFWGEMDQQRFARMIANMEDEYQKQIVNYLSTWTDISFLQACILGADRGLLHSSDGALNMTLMNAPSAGYYLSCKNTYVGGSGMVTWNNTRATYEAAVGTAIYGLTDTTGDGFGLSAHETIVSQITANLRFPQTEFMGRTLRAVALTDPWLLKRLMLRDSNNTWYTLLKDADVRGPKNRMIERDQAVIIDGILYIPVDWMRNFRAYGNNGVQPTYGMGLNSDPQTFIDTVETTSNPSGAALKKCGIVYLGAHAILHGACSKVYGAGTNVKKKNARFWITPNYGTHGKGGGWAGHMKIGFRRYEPEAKDGTTAYANHNSLVAWFYDPGPGVSFAT